MNYDLKYEILRDSVYPTVGDFVCCMKNLRKMEYILYIKI